MTTVDAAGHYYGDATPDQRPQWQAGYDQRGYDQGGYEQARADWLYECRRNHGHGKAVGGAIGNAADQRSARDYCEAYLDNYRGQQTGYGYRRQGYGYGQPGYGYGYQPMMVMVPVMMMPGGGQRDCTETVVTEEYVPDAPRRVLRRMIPPRIPIYRRAAPTHDKRVRIN